MNDATGKDGTRPVLVASAYLVLSMPVANGSVVIEASRPGEWYLYGGTLSAAIAVAASFGRWIRAAR